ncbi:MAG: hypothetical protein ACI9N1_002213 [Flavobacteriales bacterium]|jgi:hypothetical protein
MIGDIFRYNFEKNEHQIFIGGISTVEGLNLFSIIQKVHLNSIEAFNSRTRNWIPKEEFPNWKIVG